MNTRTWLICLLIGISPILHSQTLVVNAKKRTSTITINGNPSESIWEFTNNVTETVIGTPNNTVKYAVLWDSLYLYVAVTVNDVSKRNDSPNGWDDDAIEVYIDAENNGGTSYGINDRQFVKEWNSSAIWEKNNRTTGVQHAWANTTLGYAVEMRIPWSNIGITNPAAGFTIGFDVSCDDDDNGGARDSQAIWAGDSNNWQYPQNFGDLVLITTTDTQAPTAPSNLIASNLAQTSLTLNWTASTDNIGVTGYDVFRNGIKINSSLVTTTSYSVTGLTAATAYQFYIQAKDAAGNTSANSNTINVTTPDTQAPTAPSNLVASNLSQTSLTLAWLASSDNVGVTGYDVFQDGIKINPSPVTSTGYNVTGLTPATAYQFYIQAKDAAGNTSANSNTVNTTTLTPPDTEAPSDPANLVASSVTQSSLTLNWDPSTDNTGVTGYDVYQNGLKINVSNVTGTSYNVTGLNAATAYGFYIQARDAAGNTSGNSNTLNVTTPDTQAPTAPTGLWVTDLTQTSLTLNWIAATDNVGVTGYDVYQDNVKINTTPITLLSYPVTGLTAATAYQFYVQASDAAGNTSNSSSITATTLLPPDTEAPTTPSGLAASAITQSSLLLTWTASADNIGVTGYDIYQDNVKINSSLVATTSYNVNGLTALSSYNFYIVASDAAGNLSDNSDVLTVTTPDTQTPSAPTNLSYTDLTASTLTLNWAAATDNVGVTGYDIYQNGVKINTVPVIVTTYDITGLTQASSYNFFVKALDAAGNVSLSSNTVYVTTPDTESPSAPSGLQASNLTAVSVTLSWTASTDNVGVAGYDVYQDNVKINGSLITSTSYTVNGLTTLTSYDFYVVAKDAADNSSSASNTISVTPPDTQAPSAPSGLAATAVTASELTLNWTAATDNIGIAGYDVYQNGAKINTVPVTATTYNVTGLTQASSYSFFVRALDASGNVSPNSNTINVTTPDTQAPSAPSGLQASNLTAVSVILNWTASTDNVGVAGYDVYQDNIKINSSLIATTSYAVSGLTTLSTYIFHIVAKDAAGNSSIASNSINVTPPDTLAPSAPSGLVSSNVTATSLTLSWTASTDNIGVAGYDVYRNGTKINSVLVITTTYNVTGLTQASTYSFYVKALDASGNVSSNSNTINVTTPDTQAPSAPSGLVSSNLLATSVTLSWTASTDNVGVTGYDVYRNGVKINASLVSTTTYAVTGLTASTAYSFYIQAKDAAGNISANSNTLSITTPAPTTCTGTGTINFQKWNAISGTAVTNLTGSASYPNSPTTSGTLTSFEIPVNGGGDNYGMKVYGYICPPTTGSYVFWIASDDNSELWLSTTSSAANKQRIAYNTSWTNSREWNKSATQKSAAITLTAGQLYYVEALMKEGAQGDNLAVGWAKPGQATTTPSEVIPGSQLVAQIADSQAPSTPTNLSSSGIGQTSFTLLWTAATDNIGVAGYDIYRNGTKVNTSLVSGITYNATGLTPSTTYLFTVIAKDLAGNSSVASNALSVTTLLPNPGQETFTQRTVIASQRMPHDLVYGPDNNIWYTERFAGRVSFVNPATGAKTIVLTLGSNMVQVGGQDGLMGLALHPQFKQGKPYVYISYTYQSTSATVRKTRIARYTYDSVSKTLGQAVTILENIPGSNDHNSSRLAIGPDVKLYYTVGDMGAGQFDNLSRTNNAQNPNVLEGKVLRLNTELISSSWIPADNPFTNAGVTTPVYSLGHRNPQGLVWGKVNGVDILYSSEHGPYSDDELNIIEQGRNYGWPLVAGFCDGNYNGRFVGGAFIVSEQNNCTTLNVKQPIRSLFPVANPPDSTTGNMTWPSTAPSGTEFYGSAAIPGWQNSLLVAQLKKGTITRFKLSNDGQSIISDTIHYFRGLGRFRDVVVSPDGLKIYVACDSSGSTSGPTGGVTSTPANPGSILEFTYQPPAGGRQRADEWITENKAPAEIKDKSTDVYPNPASSYFIVYNYAAETGRSIELMDMNGKVVKRQIVVNLATRVDVSAISAGLYVLKVTDAKGKTVRTEKIVVIK